ncbi:MAG: hypothetical protein WC467_02175 [Patescibacteria group bacterium]
MEENKIENGPVVSGGAAMPEAKHSHSGHHGEHHLHHEGHSGHHGHGMGCHGHHCAHMGYHLIKAIVVFFVVILLLCIGAAMGARHGSRYNNFDRYGNGGSCGFRTEMPIRGSNDGRYFMMGNAQAVPTQGVQYIEVQSTTGGVPTTVTKPSAPATGGTTTQKAPVK